MKTLVDKEWKANLVSEENLKDVFIIMDTLRKEIKDTKLVAYDFETAKSGGEENEDINPLKDIILSVSFCASDETAYSFRLGVGEGWVYPEEVMNKIREFLKWVFFESGANKIAHNLKFDCKMVYRLTGMLPDVRDKSFEDTMVMGYLLDENRSQKLELLAGRYLSLDAGKYKKALADAGKISNMKEIPWSIVGPYNSSDSWLTRKLYKVILERLKQDELYDLYERMYKGLLNILLETEIIGFQLDTDYLKNKKEEINKEIESLKEKMEEVIKSIGTLDKEFNPRSPKQVKDILAKLNLTSSIKKKTEKGAVSTDKEALESIVKLDKSKFVESLLKYREIEKLRTFVDGLLERADNGVVRSNFVPHGTVTGRLSSRDPNFQNLPRGRSIRWAFQARENKKLVIADFSQLELRVAAFYADEKTMMEVFKRGGDIHARTAIICWKLNCEESEVKKLHKDKRDKAKGVNFGVLYDLSAPSLAKNIDVSIGEAEEFIVNYYKEFGKIKTYKEEIKKEAIEKEFISNIFGRRRRFPGLYELVRKFGRGSDEVEYKLREAFNAQIQGTGVDICNLSIVKIKSEANKRGIDCKLLAQVHDEMVWEVDEKQIEEFSEILKRTAENIIDGFQTPIEMKVLNRWGENYEA